MEYNSDLSDRVNICPPARNHIKSHVKNIFQNIPSLILMQVMIIRLPIRQHSRLKYCLTEIVPIIIGLEVHGLIASVVV